MRTVTFGINISVDGYCDHTIGSPSEELMDYYTAMMDDVDLLFFGRIMYQMMFPYWSNVARDKSGSTAGNRFAERLSAIERVVISTTLDSEDAATRIIRSNPAGELLKLKQQPGRKIFVDTISMLPELTNAGLIDEFHLVVHPVIAGQGRQLFPAGSLDELFSLTLISTKPFQNGCVAHHYRKQ